MEAKEHLRQALGIGGLGGGCEAGRIAHYLVIVEDDVDATRKAG